MMWPIDTLFLIFGTFLLAGLVKGVIGLGFPTIIIALLAVPLGLRDAMALMLLPCFLTNLWQASAGGWFLVISRRFWSLFLLATFAIWITTGFLDQIENAFLLCLLGGIVLLYGALGILSPKLTISQRAEPWLTLCVGVINGVLTGLTGNFVLPGVLYFQSLNLGREQFIQAMGLLFLISTLALGAGLYENQFISSQHGFTTTLALIPSFLGMYMGQRVRRKLSETSFRRIFYLSLMMLGLYILISGLFSAL